MHACLPICQPLSREASGVVRQGTSYLLKDVTYEKNTIVSTNKFCTAIACTKLPVWPLVTDEPGWASWPLKVFLSNFLAGYV